MAKVRTPRSRWIDAGLAALAEGGPRAVSVEPLAKALGVTKGGFYWHFEDRQALLDALLDDWEHRLVDEVIEAVEAAGGGPRERLRHLFGLAGAAWSRGAMGAELAIRNWARHDPAVSARLRRVDNRRMDFLRAQFAALEPDQAEARSLICMTIFVGNHFVAADHGGRRRREIVADVLELLLA